mmetsp:Transcript_1513/g.1864  ORF Transcript_1513/g.1864 Transcript_1513/m.1864 type:complete len:204 (+) Transcript_1513:73-684(+)
MAFVHRHSFTPECDPISLYFCFSRFFRSAGVSISLGAAAVAAAALPLSFFSSSPFPRFWLPCCTITLPKSSISISPSPSAFGCLFSSSSFTLFFLFLLGVIASLSSPSLPPSFSLATAAGGVGAAVFGTLLLLLLLPLRPIFEEAATAAESAPALMKASGSPLPHAANLPSISPACSSARTSGRTRRAPKLSRDSLRSLAALL